MAFIRCLLVIAIIAIAAIDARRCGFPNRDPPLADLGQMCKNKNKSAETCSCGKRGIDTVTGESVECKAWKTEAGESGHSYCMITDLIESGLPCQTGGKYGRRGLCKTGTCSIDCDAEEGCKKKCS